MEREEEQIYEPIRQHTIQNDHAYELQDIYINEDIIRSQQPQVEVQSNSKKQSSSWSPPFIVLTVLLCLILYEFLATIVRYHTIYTRIGKNTSLAFLAANKIE